MRSMKWGWSVGRVRSVEGRSEGKVDAFVSVVAVLQPDTVGLSDFVADVHRVASESYTNYEIVIVLNGVALEELVTLRDLLHDLSCIRVLRLSRQFSYDTAIFAGLEAAIGDYIVHLTPVVDPVDVIPHIVALAMTGHDVIQGISTLPSDRRGLRGLGRRMFYAYNTRFLKVDIPQRATYLTCLSRRALNSLTNASRSLRYLRHLIRHIGYRLAEYQYSPVRTFTASSSFRRDVLTGAEMVTSYSSHPLRVVTLIGVLAGMGNFLYAIYVVVLAIARTDLAPGWVTTSLQLSATFFIFSIILAVQAEYVGRILAETRREPPYFIMEEFESDSLIPDAARRNVAS